MASGDDSIEFAAIQKLQYALQVKKLNEELLEQLASSLGWLIHYSQVYQIELPEKEKIIALVDRAIAIETRLPTANEQPKKNNRRWNITTIVVLLHQALFLLVVVIGCSIAIGSWFI